MIQHFIVCDFKNILSKESAKEFDDIIWGHHVYGKPRFQGKIFVDIIGNPIRLFDYANFGKLTLIETTLTTKNKKFRTLKSARKYMIIKSAGKISLIEKILILFNLY